MNERSTLVSIVMPCYNDGRYIEESVASVKAQTWPNTELIIADDGSDDPRTVEVLCALEACGERVLHLSHRGLAGARNAAIAAAGGKYILPLDSDDLIEPTYIEQAVAVLEQNETVGVVYCHADLFGEQNGPWNLPEFSPMQMLLENVVFATALFRRSDWKTVGGYCEKLKTGLEDWDFWLSLIELGRDFVQLPEILFHYRKKPVSMSTPLVKALSDIQYTYREIYLTHRVLYEKYAQEYALSLRQAYLKLLYDDYRNTAMVYDDLGREYSAKCREYESALQSQRDQIKQQGDVLAQQQLQTAQLQALYDAKCGEYESALQAQRTQQLQTARLQALYDAKCSDYAAITGGFCWRMTKPLRIFLDKLKYLFRNSRAAHRLWNRAKALKGGNSAASVVDAPATAFYPVGDSMTILCTKHTLFVARLVQNSLRKVGICADIITDEPKRYGEQVYIVICPQMFKKMPERYIAFQMEQTVSTHWLTNEYYHELKNAYAVFDYSLVNIHYFKKTTEFGKNFYYLPIDYLPGYRRVADTYDYDVAFYGDVNNPRRKQILEKLQEHFSVKIISEVFGEELYELLSRSRIVVNIHYYESAMLETTRLYETLSLGRSIVVSERSTDPEEEKRLEGIVDFVEIGDTNTMIERIGYWLSHEREFADKIAQNNALFDDRSSAFDYFFLRFLLANDWLSFDRFYELAGDFVHFDGNRICLSLPEAVDRRTEFDRDNRFGFQVIPGLRHRRGWTGCGLSYKFIMKKAQEQHMEDILVCEDDVLFPEDFEQRFERCLHYLSEHMDWDIFQGLIADVGKVTVSQVEHEAEQTFVHFDHMVSMVFNYYKSDVYQSIINWDETNDNVYKNTIDRALESKKLKIITTTPFLVGHKEELNSTVWGFNNTQYSDMIAKSSEKLERLAAEFERNAKR